jgi:hypothetical protein
LITVQNAGQQAWWTQRGLELAVKLLENAHLVRADQAGATWYELSTTG